MKKLLIVSHALELGGAESSLIGYLHTLAKAEDVETELFLYRHKGELMKYIPEGIKLLPEKQQYSCLAVPLKNVVKRGRFAIALGRAYGKYKSNRYMKKNGLIGKKSGVALEYSHKYTKAFMPEISDTEYDLAISFLTPHYYVVNKVKAKKKVAYIHTDYAYISVDRESELKMWSAYDCIAAVSEAVMNSFVKLFPELKEKTAVIENINSTELIARRAVEFVPKEEMAGNFVKILSVGRFCDAKNFESIPCKAALLKDKGLDFKWYIIGFGDDKHIRTAIKETGTENEVVVLGKKANPYPYIKYCDIYAQPSRYEGKAVTVLEAQIIGKPVIITNYATASSQLKDGYDGIIAPMDNDAFCDKLYDLAVNKEKQTSLIRNCKNSDYSNKDEIKKLLQLLQLFKGGNDNEA
ncbi:MAG: glycosyltransferase [Ruminococcaceae bacterium]|nr:glycosyltransferase [Oscillospiraceae bacterium]